MKIRSILVKSYKSILNSGIIPLSDNITVFVGRNNSGKTALAECIRFSRVVDEPFRGFADTTESQPSTVSVELSFSGAEILTILQRSNEPTINIPVPKDRQADAELFVQEFFAAPEIVISASSIAGGQLVPTRYPSHSLAKVREAISVPISVRTGKVPSLGARDLNGDELVRRLASYIDDNVIALSAMRNIPAVSRMETNGVLDAAGTTLPACLFHMSGYKPWLFSKLKLHLLELVAEITDITFIPKNGEQVEVRVWMQAHNPPDRQISLSLSQCGTGVAQILSLLYISMVSSGKTIVIDEPNSFLHPGAAKRLIEILSNYKNQYVITTHSPEIISNPFRKLIYAVRKEGGKSDVSPISIDNVENLRDVLSDLGIAFGDVFGVEDIVWVEGETEQACFPKILAFDKIPNKTSFIVVRNTGDFQKKGFDVDKVIGIYERLSNSVALFPSKVRFSFDKEKMTAQQIADLKRRVRDRVSIIPRRTFENYLVHPEAITDVINEHMSKDLPKITSAAVTDWINSNVSKFGSQDHLGNQNLINAEFDLAKLLKELFDELSGSTLEYKKTTHSPLLLEKILEKDPTFLSELRVYVRDLVA